ncbi:zf-HC2 domain-containing protein [Myxococcota bacterium]|nr:zf-HC2 domain-containing protein [Myxococcota bacterium]
MTKHPSTLTLHKLRYNELPPDQEDALRAHLRDCPACAERLGAQESHRAAFIAAPVPEALRAAPETSAPWWRRLWWVVPLAAAAVALLSVVPTTTTTPADPAPPTERIKGAAVALEAWLDSPQGPRLLEDGAVVAEGDTIQLRFDPGPHHYVSLLGEDGAGAVQLFGTLRAEGGEIQRAPFALRLDESPGPQLLYAIYTDQRLSDEALVTLVEERRPVPEGTLRRLRLEKR